MEPLRKTRTGLCLAASAALASSGLSPPAQAQTPWLTLGAYTGTPNVNSASQEAEYVANTTAFTKLMSKSPTTIDAYTDFTQPISAWPVNAEWASYSIAHTLTANSQIPVIGFALASTAPGSMPADAQYQFFTNGSYDSYIQGVLQAWARQGFSTLYFRLAWEMNLTGPTYAGDSAQSQADWVTAFRHVYKVLHSAATANNVTVSVVWNPSATNWSNAEATKNLYPGNAYVDVIGVDIYSDIWPYSLYDWTTKQYDGTFAEFIAKPANRMHYWNYPAANQWSNDGSGGHSQSFLSLLTFARHHGKPFAVPETGAGNCNAGRDLCDDPAFPRWLGDQLERAKAAGTTIAFVNIWDSNDGGNYEFAQASDKKPLEAAAWASSLGLVSTSR